MGSWVMGAKVERGGTTPKATPLPQGLRGVLCHGKQHAQNPKGLGRQGAALVVFLTCLHAYTFRWVYGKKVRFCFELSNTRQGKGGRFWRQVTDQGMCAEQKFCRLSHA